MADIARWRSIFGGVESALVGRKPRVAMPSPPRKKQKQSNDDAEDEVAHTCLLIHHTRGLKGAGTSGTVGLAGLSLRATARVLGFGQC